MMGAFRVIACVFALLLSVCSSEHCSRRYHEDHECNSLSSERVDLKASCSMNEKGPENAVLDDSCMGRVTTYEEVATIKEKSGVYLIDIRESNEIKETGLIPGSIHIPMSEVENELTRQSPEKFQEKYGIERPNLDSPIILTCRSGRRAETSMYDLEKVGFSKLKYYAGSWLEWAQKQENK